MIRALTLTIALLIAAPAAAHGIEPLRPAPGQAIKSGQPMLEWTLAPGEVTAGVLASRMKTLVTSRWIETNWTKLDPAYTERMPEKPLPAGLWYWRAIAAVPDANPDDEDAYCFDFKGCDGNVSSDYLPSAVRTFVVPVVVRNIKIGYRFSGRAQTVTYPVTFWTNADDVQIDILARTKQRTYWRDSSTSSTPYRKNRRTFVWDVTEASCRHPMRLEMTVTSGAFRWRRVGPWFTWRCG